MVSCPPCAGGAQWEYYGLDQDSNFLYYDKQSVHEVNEIVQIWQRKVFHSKNLFRIREILGERYRKLTEKLTLYEIHCPMRTAQERAFAYYDNDDRVIDSRYYESVRDWKKILSNTDMARLYWISCGSESKR